MSGYNLHELLSSDDETIQRMEVRISIAKQIAIGMVHLHYNRPPVIHYDLKSDNVLVEKKGDDVVCKASFHRLLASRFTFMFFLDLRFWFV